jgi:hypothetical protein
MIGFAMDLGAHRVLHVQLLIGTTAATAQELAAIM